MNVQLSHSAIHESLSPLGITADELRRLPGNRDVQLARARLLQDLCSRGLPTRRLESWHYTDLRTRLKAPSRPQYVTSTGHAGGPEKVVPVVEQLIAMARKDMGMGAAAAPAAAAAKPAPVKTAPVK